MKINGPCQSSKNSHFQNEVQNEVQNILTENEFCLHENKDYFHINGFALSLAYVASVSVRFRSKERGTRVKDRAKNDASKRAGREWLSFHFPRGQNRKSRSSVFFCSETKRKR